MRAILLVAMAVVGCDDGATPERVPDAVGGDAAIDAAPQDAAVLDATPVADATPDMNLDAAPDMQPDAAEDMRPPDASPQDAAPDAAPDMAPDAAPPGPCVPDVREPNEEPSAAVQLAEPIVDGALCAEDEDWYVLDACADVEVTLGFVHGFGDLDLEAFDGLGRSLGRADSVDDDERLALEIAAPTRVYLRVYGFQDAENAYTLDIEGGGADCMLPPCPEDGAAAQADAEPLDEELVEGRAICGDADWYRIPVCAGQTVNVAARFDHRFGDIDLALYDDRGFRERRSTSTSNNEAVSYAVRRDGTVFVRVYGFRGAENGYDLEIGFEGECAVCGDGVVTGPEACDPVGAPPACSDNGFDAGEAACTPTCTLDLRACRYSRCGDGVVEGAEECDGPPEGGCLDRRFEPGGALRCTGCTVDTRDCLGGQTLSGRIRYERPRAVCNQFVAGEPCAEDDCCLDPDLDTVTLHPVRHARVAIHAFAEGRPGLLLAETWTDAEGRYAARWPGDANVIVVVWSETAYPRFTIVDNTAAGGAALYGVSDPSGAARGIDPENEPFRETILAANFGPEALDPLLRPASPFALLDTLLTSAEAVIAARPDILLPPLTVNWSVNNDRCRGDRSVGCIGTSNFSNGQLWILGKADVDTDEFDTHVVGHEWGHAFENSVGRADSIGGSHSSGQFKDPRLAWGEGQASAMAAMTLGSPHYVDSLGMDESTGIFQDMQDNGRDRNPGWFSEATVRTLLYDLFDDDDEPVDQVRLGLGPFLDVMLGERHAGTEAFATIFSFIAAAKAQVPESAAAIDALTTALLRAPDCEDAGCGMDVVVDAWGTGETHDGGWAAQLPVYRALDLGAGLGVEVRHGGDEDEGPTNWLSNTRFLRFTGDGRSQRLQLRCPDDRNVDLFVYLRGESVGVRMQQFDEGGFGDEDVILDTVADTTYAVAVRSRSDELGEFECTVRREVIE